MTIDLSSLKSALKKSEKTSYELSGRTVKMAGLVVESVGPKASVGEVCELRSKSGLAVARTEVVGFRDNRILSMLLDEPDEITPGMEIIATGEYLSVPVGDELLGRVVNGLGEPIDGKGPIKTKEKRSIYASPPNPLLRSRISEPMATGVRAIDGTLTLGKGQRIGIFSGSGIGKSTLLGMIARAASADVNVIALIGERGREVREFIEKDLGESGLKKSVVVVATSDAPPLVRVKSALTATAIAEYFRDKYLDVIFMMDSATRLAMAQREVGLTIGEPPTTKGYTPSVFSLLQKTMERTGASSKGSITGLYSVLVEGDDINEPISDAARGVLDGHAVLSRKLASSGHYPAIDILASVSRVMRDIVDNKHYEAAALIKELYAQYRESEDLISVGAYKKGTNPKLDVAIELKDELDSFLRQKVEEVASFEETVAKLLELAEKAKKKLEVKSA